MFLQHTINGILVIIEGLEAACDTGKVNWGMVPYVKHKCIQPAKDVMQLSHKLCFAQCMHAAGQA